MNAERDSGISSDLSPYVDWDETIDLPSRKERFSSRKQKNKQKIKSSKKHQHKIQEVAEPPLFQNTEDATVHNQHEQQQMSATDVVPTPAHMQEQIHSRPLTREQLRRRRKRYVKVMRFLRFVRRILIGIIGFVVLLLVAFWWKFVFVYNLPDYIQKQNPHVKAYIAWKPWTFGPPMLDLRASGNPHTKIEIDSYLIHMDAYKEVIENPFIIWRFKE